MALKWTATPELLSLDLTDRLLVADMSQPSGDRDAQATLSVLMSFVSAQLADVASSGNYSDLSGLPTLGGAAALNVGTTAGTVAAGDDSRLSDARTPTAHASTHAAAGSDPITPAAIGAVPLADGIVKVTTDARPAGAGVVYYFLPDEPTTGVDGDFWFDTSA